MTSQKRIDANRRNALQSTGPRTAEGKARSRANSLKHGMAGAGIVLPDEDRARWERRSEVWAEELGARGELDYFLASRAALASVRLDRCVRAETATLEPRRVAALARWQEGRVEEARVDILVEALDADPAGAATGLERSVLGCVWMLDGWDCLALALAESGCWNDDQMREALDLLGLPGVPTVSSDPAASVAWAAGLAASAHEGYPDGVEEWERFFEVTSPEADPEARHASAVARLMEPFQAFTTLARLCDSERDRLGALRDALWETVDGPARQQALDRVMVDTSAEGMLRRRYETASTSELHRALDQVHRNHRAADRASFETNPRNEANEAETPEATRVSAAPSGSVAAATVEPEATSSGGTASLSTSVAVQAKPLLGQPPMPSAAEVALRDEPIAGVPTAPQFVGESAWEGLATAFPACPEGAFLP